MGLETPHGTSMNKKGEAFEAQKMDEFNGVKLFFKLPETWNRKQTHLKIGQVRPQKETYILYNILYIYSIASIHFSWRCVLFVFFIGTFQIIHPFSPLGLKVREWNEAFSWFPSGKLTWQWKMDLLKIYSLLKMGIFHCHVSLLEGMMGGWNFHKKTPSFFVYQMDRKGQSHPSRLWP